MLASLESVRGPQKSLFAHTFLMRFNFVFCSKRMKTIQTIKITNCYDFISLNNADNLFTAR